MSEEREELIQLLLSMNREELAELFKLLREEEPGIAKKLGLFDTARVF